MLRQGVSTPCCIYDVSPFRKGLKPLVWECLRKVLSLPPLEEIYKYITLPPIGGRDLGRGALLDAPPLRVNILQG